MYRPTEQELRIQEQTEQNRDHYGNMYMDYVSHMLPMAMEEENLQVISRIRKMSYEEFQQFDIYPVPAKLSDRFQILGWKMVRKLKVK